MGFLKKALGLATSLGGLPGQPDNSEQTLGLLEPLKAPVKAATDPQPSFPKANEFLGSNVGKAINDIGGGFLDDARGLRNTKKNFEFLEGKGLTSAEIAGGSTGGPVGAQGNTLGSGPATQVQSQQQFAAVQAQKDRDNRKEVAHISASAAGRQAGVAEVRDKRDSELAPLTRRKVSADTDLTKQRLRMEEFLFDNFWQIKFATMGPENAKVALAMFNSGLDLQRILTAAGDITEQERADVEKLYNILLKITGASGGAIGWLQLLQAVATGEGTLDTQRSGFLERLPEGRPTGILERDPTQSPGAYGGGPGPRKQRRATDRPSKNKWSSGWWTR